MSLIEQSTQEKLSNLSIKDRLKNNATLAASPSGNASLVIKSYCTAFGEQDAQEIFSALANSLTQALQGENKTAEKMLTAQAYSLQSIFSMLAHKATLQNDPSHMETCLRLAFKAQSQCRKTLEALSNLKKPSTIYAKQANIAHGHQQVNNQASSDATMPASEK